MKKRGKIIRSDAGMTLIEVILAMGIFAMALVMMIGSILSITAMAKVNEQSSEAITQLSGVVEEVQGIALSDLLEGYQIPDPLGLGPSATFELACMDPEGNRIVLPPEGELGEAAVQALDEPVEIEITLQWRNPQGHLMTKRALAAVWR